MGRHNKFFGAAREDLSQKGQPGSSNSSTTDVTENSGFSNKLGHLETVFEDEGSS